MQQRMRLARRHAGLSQTQLAQRVGVQRSAVSHWESPDGNSPKVAHLREVATVAGVHFEWLATGRGAMSISADVSLDSVSAVLGELIDDDAELRLIRSYREVPAHGRMLLVEIAELMRTLRKNTRPSNRHAR